jgi:hypothetical protein
VQVHYAPMPEEGHGTIYHPAALRAFRLLFGHQASRSATASANFAPAPGSWPR